MLKLTICLLSGALLAALTLQLRQQRRELAYENSQIHAQIRDQQAKLWDQQLQIAVCTAPNAIRRTVSGHDLKLVPQSALPGGRRNWMEPSERTKPQ
jgi:hypothetical protein